MYLGSHVFLQLISSESASWALTTTVKLDHVLAAELQNLVLVRV